MPDTKRTYCFDTSAFIDAWRRYYSPEFTFCKPVWDCVEKLMENKLMVIHEEVLNELKDKDDLIYKFVKKYPDIQRKTDEAQLEFVSKILSTHGQIIDKQKTQKNHADVWVIALAKMENATVVTFESAGKGFGIPSVCKAYKVNCMSFQDFIKVENI